MSSNKKKHHLARVRQNKPANRPHLPTTEQPPATGNNQTLNQVTFSQSNYFIPDTDLGILQSAAAMPEDIRAFALRHTQEEAAHRRSLEKTKEDHDYALSKRNTNYIFITDLVGKILGCAVAILIILFLGSAVIGGSVSATIISSLIAAASLYKLLGRNNSAK